VCGNPVHESVPLLQELLSLQLIFSHSIGIFFLPWLVQLHLQHLVVILERNEEERALFEQLEVDLNIPNNL
jgi:hypothetical protein